MAEFTHISAAGSFLTRFLRRKLNQIAPRRIKRLFFISSLICLVLNNRSPDLGLLKKINDVLNLSYTSTGMLFPVYMGFTHWDDLDFNRTPMIVDGVECKVTDLFWASSDHDLWRVAYFYTTHAPDWLVYASQSLMTTDAHDMFKLLKKDHCAP